MDACTYSTLDAYGWDGHSLVSYWGSGLDGPQTTSFTTGQVWWLMYAARWSHDMLDRVWTSRLVRSVLGRRTEARGRKDIFLPKCKHRHSTDRLKRWTTRRTFLSTTPVLTADVTGGWTMNDGKT